MEQVSAFTKLGVPESFAVLLLTLGFILALAPWIPPGADFGLFKIPEISQGKRLRYIGPITFLLSLALILPLWPIQRLTLADASFNDKDEIEMKISNSGDAPAFITKAKVKVLRIYTLHPNSIPLSHVEVTGHYTMTFPLQAYPYEFTIDLSQLVAPKDVDRFVIGIKPYPEGLAEDFPDVIYIALWQQEKTDWPKLESLLDERRENLIRTLNLSLEEAAFFTPTIVFDFELTLIYNKTSSLPVGRFIYTTGLDPSPEWWLPIPERNQPVLKKIAESPAQRSKLTQEFLELAGLSPRNKLPPLRIPTPSATSQPNIITVVPKRSVSPTIAPTSIFFPQ